MYRPDATYVIQEQERLAGTRGSYSSLRDSESPPIPAGGGGGAEAGRPKAQEVREQVALAVPDAARSSAGSSPGTAPASGPA